MANQTDGVKKPNPMPLIIAGVVVALVILFLVAGKGRRRQTSSSNQSPDNIQPTPKDPCAGIPEWACATAALLDPLAQTSVAVAKAQAQSQIDMARLKAGR